VAVSTEMRWLVCRGSPLIISRLDHFPFSGGGQTETNEKYISRFKRIKAIKAFFMEKTDREESVKKWKEKKEIVYFRTRRWVKEANSLRC
jgi:hypothetical protein